MKQRPEPGVEYGSLPTAEYAEARSLDAAVSLGRALGVSSLEARRMLADGTAAAELRARQSPASQLRRRWRPGYPDPCGG